MYNHWIAKIRFKEKIEKYLMPLLKPYINHTWTSSSPSMIRGIVDDWIDSQLDTVFDCKILVEFGSVNVVKSIKVIPQDI